jgi:hypothetical protein
MLMTQSYQQSNQPQYVEALLLCEKRKVCTNLAKKVTKKIIFSRTQCAFKIRTYFRNAITHCIHPAMDTVSL